MDILEHSQKKKKKELSNPVQRMETEMRTHSVIQLQRREVKRENSNCAAK